MKGARLLSPTAARRYLGGQDPDAFSVRPIFVRGEQFYDRAALDAKLDQLSGIGPPAKGDDPESRLQEWISSRGAS